MAGTKVNSGTETPGKTKLEAGSEFIKDKIRSGEWKPGYKLPSQAAWASGTPGHKLLYGTLRSVYIVLRTQGWLIGQQGDGVYVAPEPPEFPKAPVELAVANGKVKKATAVPTAKRTKRS